MKRSGPALWFDGYSATFALSTNDRYVVERASQVARSLGWTPTRDVAADIAYVLEALAPTDSSRVPRFVLHGNSVLIRSAGTLQEALDAFEHHARIQTALHAKRHLFVHAGVVVWDGSAIIVPGRSCTGKSTLVKALVEAGASYYSDEFAPLDEDGRVHPYSLPLSIRTRGLEPAARIPSAALGRAGRAAVPVGLIVVAQFRRRSRWCPRRMSTGEALLALMDNAVTARRSPAWAMQILRRTVVGAKAIQSRRGEAAGIARGVLAELA